MADLINLRQARKRKARADHEAQADENRMRFGLTKAERETTRASRKQAAARIEGHKREDGR